MEAEVVAALVAAGGSACIALASGVLGIRNRRSMIALQSELDTQREKEVADHQASVEEQVSEKRRIREEVLRWTNPVLEAVDALESRLKNILNDGLYLAMRQHRDERPVNPDWAVSYDYVLPTTLYLFAYYFAWVRLLQERLSFELFGSEEVKERFFAALWRVNKALASWPLEGVTGGGRDAQVFALQQRAIGEAVIQRGLESARPMTVPQFLDAYRDEDDLTFHALLEPLRSLVEDLEPESKRWTRLSLTLAALRAFKDECRRLLSLRGATVDGAEGGAG
jgi:hypothetical protein